ncbi:MAG TPA: elongation factor P maturation arginine rhamnosyltransferase EarP [Aquabacterium sp.]|nr:elongation factor P maturation arginine rhamnosyltransferase EarP [Aquabacterium sp.]
MPVIVPIMAAMLWDIFCRVIDNFGDIGVCWRLSADLASRGHRVRLWIDDPSALCWMAPGQSQVEVYDWNQAASTPVSPGDVVIEAFGCNPPDAFVSGMQRALPPVWINLEYLSAEDYVERSHGLRSPVGSGPGAGLQKWFFYPGFTSKTGGLLREPDLISRRDAFLAHPAARDAWLQSIGVDTEPDRQYVSVFCYDSAPLDRWLSCLVDKPVTVLLTPGPSTRLARQWQATRTGSIGALRLHELPHLPQREFDFLLWSCDLNLVRGEDSAVRALWAARPHVWQIYEQDDGVHADKLDAFMARWMDQWPSELAEQVRCIWRSWNGLNSDDAPLSDLLNLAVKQVEWGHFSQLASQKLANQVDLTTQLIEFVTRPR